MWNMLRLWHMIVLHILQGTRPDLIKKNYGTAKAIPSQTHFSLYADNIIESAWQALVFSIRDLLDKRVSSEFTAYKSNSP